MSESHNFDVCSFWDFEGQRQRDHGNLFTTMPRDSVGAYGSKIKGLTPHIDALAASALRFDRAHVNIAVCQPCRNTLNSGRYPHRNIEGFQEMEPNKYPTIPHVLKEQGYYVGVLGKAGHSRPYKKFAWDMEHDRDVLASGRGPEQYGSYVKRFIEKAKKAGKPFYLMANAHDPHRPFHKENRNNKFPAPSKIYEAGEIPIPGFLPDLPEIRTEIARYYSSVRRADDVVGEILKQLKASGLEESTAIFFLSDHGIAVPFAKTNCYYHSTKTPLIVRWPGVTKAGSIVIIKGIEE